MATILVVDDRSIDREFLATLLGYAGYRVLEASDGLEAIEMVWTQGADLIITDILMPTMDGFEFVRRLRAHVATAETPVIFYSATYHQREARALAQEAGVAHVLLKPAEVEVILDTVSMVLGPSQAQESSARQPAVEQPDREVLRVLAEKLAHRVSRLEAIDLKPEALVRLSQQLALAEDATSVGERFCQAARELVGARIAAIGVLHRDGKRLRQFAICGVDEETAARLHPPLAHDGIFGTLLKERAPIRMSGAQGELQVAGLPAHHPPVHAFLGVPIVSSRQAHGWMYFVDKVGAVGSERERADAKGAEEGSAKMEEFDEDDERVALVLAAQVAVAYERTAAD
jgi:CheY-like chemotaxis protein